MQLELALRSRRALESVIGEDSAMQRSMSRLLLTPIDPKMEQLFIDSQEDFSINKRRVQEQCAHFIFRHLVQNNLRLGQNSQDRHVMGLAGLNPELALASYARRSLFDKAVLFEKISNRYFISLQRKDKAEELWEQLDPGFWGANPGRKQCTIRRGDYFEETRVNEKFVGFLFDCCGQMSPAEEVASYTVNHIGAGIFFVEATMLDGRSSNPAIWEVEFEQRMREKGIWSIAKDSFEYKGGKSSTRGSPMKTYVWIMRNVASLNPGEVLGIEEAVKKSDRRGQRGLYEEIRAYISDNQGCTVSDIASDLRLNESQIRNAMRHLRDSGTELWSWPEGRTWHYKIV